MLVLGAVYLLINGLAFFLMLDDKQRARRNQTRVSEGNLLFAAIALGALGVMGGMLLFRHKTRKLIFVLGVPLALLQNLLLIYGIYLQLPR